MTPAEILTAGDTLDSPDGQTQYSHEEEAERLLELLKNPKPLSMTVAGDYVHCIVEYRLALAQAKARIEELSKPWDSCTHCKGLRGNRGGGVIQGYVLDADGDERPCYVLCACLLSYLQRKGM